MKRLKLSIAITLCLLGAWLAYGTQAQSRKSQQPATDQYREWRRFGGGPENIHYSTLDQITKANVNQLEVAWTYDTGDEFPGSEIQCNPVMVDGVLYALTPKVRVIALDAATGKLIW